jgi:hypothetical protein
VVEFIDRNGISGYQQGDFVIGRWLLRNPGNITFNNVSSETDQAVVRASVLVNTRKQDVKDWMQTWTSVITNRTRSAMATAEANNTLSARPTAEANNTLSARPTDILRGGLTKGTLLSNLAAAATNVRDLTDDDLGDLLFNETQDGVDKFRLRASEMALARDANGTSAVPKSSSFAATPELSERAQLLWQVLLHQLKCADNVNRTCSKPTKKCSQVSLAMAVFGPDCCARCKMEDVAFAYVEAPSKKRSAPTTTFEFSLLGSGEAVDSKKKAPQLDPSTVKFSINITNTAENGLELRSHSNKLPGSLAIRFSVSVLKDKRALRALKPRQKPARADRSLWAAEDGKWTKGSERFDVGDEEEGLILSDSAMSDDQLLLTWATTATVRGCDASGVAQTVPVTTYRSFMQHKVEDDDKWPQERSYVGDIETHWFFASIDLSSCTQSPTVIEIDPNLTVVTEGSETVCDAESLGDCASADKTPSSGTSATIYIAVGASVAAALLLVLIVVCIAQRKRKAKVAAGSSGLA